jgi:hypothetical protein
MQQIIQALCIGLANYNEKQTATPAIAAGNWTQDVNKITL